MIKVLALIISIVPISGFAGINLTPPADGSMDASIAEIKERQDSFQRLVDSIREPSSPYNKLLKLKATSPELYQVALDFQLIKSQMDILKSIKELAQNQAQIADLLEKITNENS